MIDKMGQDFPGDRLSSCLKLLDPEQNSTFVDHYLEVEYDLSNVLFFEPRRTPPTCPSPFGWTGWRSFRCRANTTDEKAEIARQPI